MEERHLLLGRENNCGEPYKQSGTLQFSFEFFGYAFRNAKDCPGGDHSSLLARCRAASNLHEPIGTYPLRKRQAHFPTTLFASSGVTSPMTTMAVRSGRTVFV